MAPPRPKRARRSEATAASTAAEAVEQEEPPLLRRVSRHSRSAPETASASTQTRPLRLTRGGAFRERLAARRDASLAEEVARLASGLPPSLELAAANDAVLNGRDLMQRLSPNRSLPEDDIVSNMSILGSATTPSLSAAGSPASTPSSVTPPALEPEEPAPRRRRSAAVRAMRAIYEEAPRAQRSLSSRAAAVRARESITSEAQRGRRRVRAAPIQDSDSDSTDSSESESDHGDDDPLAEMDRQLALDFDVEMSTNNDGPRTIVLPPYSAGGPTRVLRLEPLSERLNFDFDTLTPEEVSTVVSMTITSNELSDGFVGPLPLGHVRNRISEAILQVQRNRAAGNAEPRVDDRDVHHEMTTSQRILRKLVEGLSGVVGGGVRLVIPRASRPPDQLITYMERNADEIDRMIDRLREANGLEHPVGQPSESLTVEQQAMRTGMLSRLDEIRRDVLDRLAARVDMPNGGTDPSTSRPSNSTLVLVRRTVVEEATIHRPLFGNSGFGTIGAAGESRTDDGGTEAELREREDAHEASDECFKSSEWGECRICMSEEPGDPVGCKHCRQLVGCKKCAARWYRAGRRPAMNMLDTILRGDALYRVYVRDSSSTRSSTSGAPTISTSTLFERAPTVLRTIVELGNRTRAAADDSDAGAAPESGSGSGAATESSSGGGSARMYRNLLPTTRVIPLFDGSTNGSGGGGGGGMHIMLRASSSSNATASGAARTRGNVDTEVESAPMGGFTSRATDRTHAELLRSQGEQINDLVSELRNRGHLSEGHGVLLTSISTEREEIETRMNTDERWIGEDLEEEELRREHAVREDVERLWRDQVADADQRIVSIQDRIDLLNQSSMNGDDDEDEAARSAERYQLSAVMNEIRASATYAREREAQADRDRTARLRAINLSHTHWQLRQDDMTSYMETIIQSTRVMMDAIEDVLEIHRRERGTPDIDVEGFPDEHQFEEIIEQLRSHRERISRLRVRRSAERHRVSINILQSRDRERGRETGAQAIHRRLDELGIAMERQSETLSRSPFRSTTTTTTTIGDGEEEGGGTATVTRTTSDRTADVTRIFLSGHIGGGGSSSDSSWEGSCPLCRHKWIDAPDVVPMQHCRPVGEPLEDYATCVPKIEDES